MGVRVGVGGGGLILKFGGLICSFSEKISKLCGNNMTRVSDPHGTPADQLGLVMTCLAKCPILS